MHVFIATFPQGVALGCLVLPHSGRYASITRNRRRDTVEPNMGFSVYFRSTEPVAPDVASEIEHAAGRASVGMSWLSCEPCKFYPLDNDGHLSGGSKPNFSPHPDDVASAATENLRDGTLWDLLGILCDLSKTFGVDWAFSHDHDPNIGFIRGGFADAKLRGQIEAFSDLYGTLNDFVSEFNRDSFGIDDLSASDDEDDDPPIFKFPSPSDQPQP